MLSYTLTQETEPCCAELTAELDHAEVVPVLNMSYLEVILCCTELTSELSMVRSCWGSSCFWMWATLKWSDVVQNVLLN